MPALVNRSPRYTRHKRSGQAVVYIGNKVTYLGKYNSPESRRKYEAVIAEHFAARAAGLPTRRESDLERQQRTVGELVAAFLDHASSYYPRERGRSSEYDNFRDAVRPLLRLYLDLPVREFTQKRLIAVRQTMIESGLSMTYINRQVGRIRQVFYWAVRNELVDVQTASGLAKVSALKPTRTTARQRPEVRPVPREMIEAICSHVSSRVATMMRIQANTGMRPDEVCAMQPAQIDTSERPDGMWRYRPTRHKTQHRGHDRLVLLNAAVQSLLKPFLEGRAVDSFLFSPAEALAEQELEKRSNTSRAPGARYSVASYRRAIERACKRAFPLPEPLARKKRETQEQYEARLTDAQREERNAWIKAHRFHPHQIRHLAATEVRATGGPDAVKLLLGVRSMKMVDLYAEKDAKQLAEVMLNRSA